MTALQTAGVVGRLFSSVFPKKLEVQVRTEELSDGHIALQPVCLLAGQEVALDLVGPSPRQRILGYSVVADTSVLTVCRQGAATLSKPRAAEYLRDLKRNGVPVQGKTRQSPVNVQEVKPKIVLTLNSGDALVVKSEVVTREGASVPKPRDLEQLRRDEGWYAADGCLLHITTTGSDWDTLTITTDHGNGVVTKAAFHVIDKDHREYDVTAKDGDGKVYLDIHGTVTRR